MAQRVDMSRLETEIAVFMATQQRSIDMPEQGGVVSRMQFAIVPAITRWRAQECNRGTDDNAVANALIGLFASTFQSVVTTVEPNRTEQLAVINRFLRALGEEIAAIRVGARDTINHRVGMTNNEPS